MSPSVLPSFLVKCFTTNESGVPELNLPLLTEKFDWVREETLNIPGWDQKTLQLFQKTYSHKNRYVNRLPYERCRVKLDASRNPKACDYINASLLSLPGHPTTYIATQAPIRKTVGDFWQMVAEQGVQLIVMLVVADGFKCERYWPEREGQLSFPGTNITVAYKGLVRHTTNAIVKEFSLTDGKGGPERTVRHYNFVSWPDHGVPSSTKPLIRFVEAVREDPLYAAPVLVHCSAGVGRTGTFCVIDNILNLLLNKTNTSVLPDGSAAIVDSEDFDPVAEYTLAFRHQRISIVETFKKDELQPGIQGFLVTCFRNVEAKCTNEVYYLLSQALESLSPATPTEEDMPAGASTASFEEQISSEVGELTKRKDRPFIVVETKGLQCVVFVRALKEIDVCALMERMFSLIRERSIRSVKFCQRIMPIQTVCMARIDDIRQEATRLITAQFPTEPTDYCVVFESRLNDSLDRMTIINMLADIVPAVHKVKLSSPALVVLVQVFKAHCGLSILSGWSPNRKYNVQEVIKATLDKQQ